MLPTFVIGLREGLEAALIVGIIAAFLRKQGRGELVRLVFVGVGAAIAICVAAGVTLDAFSRSLPQRQQEGLETVIGLLAVGMVTYMVVWMKRHSRGLKAQLEGMAGAALHGPGRAGWAMIGMALLAVLREGIETVVFLIAAFNESGSHGGAGAGLVLGLVVAAAVGYGIYRGGVRLNLSKFFRATGVVLVLVAAGLVVNALHTAHEAGWLTVGQGPTVDLSALVRPGSVQASLLTGMLGLQAQPVVAEVLGWTVYVLVVGTFVVWPAGTALHRAVVARVVGGVAAVAALGAALLLVARPGSVPAHPVTRAGGVSAQVGQLDGDRAVVRTETRDPLTGATGAPVDLALTAVGAEDVDGVPATVLRSSTAVAVPSGLPDRLSRAELAAANSGRLPIGLDPRAEAFTVRYTGTGSATAWIDARTGTVLDVRWTASVRASVAAAPGVVATLSRPVRTGTVGLPTGVRAAAAADARTAAADLDRRQLFGSWAGLLGAAAVAALLALVALGAAGRRERRAAAARTLEASVTPAQLG